MLIEKKKIVKFIKSKKYSPMSASQLSALFEIDKNEFKNFCDILNDLEFKGELVKIKKGLYANPERVDLVVGTLDCKSQGFGFVVPVKEEITNDVYVNEEFMADAMNGDLVVVRLPQKQGGKKRTHKQRKWDSGKIVQVLSRANETIIGTLRRSRKLIYVAPDDPGLVKDVYVNESDLNGAECDDKVVVKIVSWPSKHLNPEGEVVEVLGKEGSHIVDIISTIHQFKLPHEFSDEVKREIKDIPVKIPDEELKNRVDYRNETIITIDPEDAKDFDDAVSLKKAGENWILGVYIADVSYYVKQDSEIDKEAKVRGTSVYLPEKVIPMLPEELSNGICSLKQGEDRLTKSVIFTMNNKGELLNSEINNSIINVKKRLNYDEATKLCNDNNGETSPSIVDDDVLSMLLNMKTLGAILFKNRLNRGSIELDIPEVKLRLDDEGYVVAVDKCEKDVSHSIIEEFMLSANEAVGNVARKNKLPCFYRNHEDPDPDDMRDFARFIKSLKMKKVDPFNNLQIQELLDDINGQPDSYAINLMLLKSFRRAEYSVNKSSHYALAIENYTHFTSPIRRYPDLIVHRVLDSYILKNKIKSGETEQKELLKESASHCSYTERRAEEAERSVIKTKLIRMVETRLNEEMEGVITGVEEYGFFVQLKENLLEGLVHVKTLTDDFYNYEKKSGSLKGQRGKNIYRIGSAVKVEIYNVDKLKKHVDFKVVQSRKKG